MYPLGCYCWSCFHLRKFQEFNSPRALNPLIQKKKKRDRVVVSPGEFLPLRFDETPTRAVRLRGVLLFLFLRGALFEWKNRGVSWFVVFFALKRGRLDSRKNAFIFFSFGKCAIRNLVASFQKPPGTHSSCGREKPFVRRALSSSSSRRTRFYWRRRRRRRRRRRKAQTRKDGNNYAFEIEDFNNTTSTISWALDNCSENTKERFCEQMAWTGDVELL